jgi:GNAT superfamily N-acetyltransferase
MANDSESAIKLYTKMGYADLSESVDIYTLPLLPPSGFKSYLKSALLWGARTVVFPKTFSTDISTTVPEGAEELWGQIARSPGVSVVKDTEYLRWRYELCPSTRFSFLSIHERGRLRGIAVVTTVKQQGVIMDLLVTPGDQAGLTALIRGALRYFKGEGCTECYTHISRGWGRRLFFLFGFYRGVSSIGFMTQTSGNDAAMLDSKRPGAWHFNLGDTDRI